MQIHDPLHIRSQLSWCLGHEEEEEDDPRHEKGCVPLHQKLDLSFIDAGVWPCDIL